MCHCLFELWLDFNSFVCAQIHVQQKMEKTDDKKNTCTKRKHIQLRVDDMLQRRAQAKLFDSEAMQSYTSHDIDGRL